MFLLLVSDFLHLEVVTFLQSPSHFDPSILASDFLHLGLFPSAHSLVKLDLLLLPFGVARTEFVFSMLVLDVAHLDLSVSTHSFARLEALPLAFDFGSFESLLLLGWEFVSTFRMEK